jgi:DNA-binding NarL/FixJ family response regulator
VPVTNPVWNPWRSTAALAAQRLRRTDEAVALVEEEVGLLRRWGAPSYLGSSLRLLGELRGRAGAPQLREAVELLTPTPAAVELARARCALGAAPEVPDDEVVELLRAALDAAIERGARGIARRAKAALAGRGRPDTSGPDVESCPTATERRIVELAADGRGVREIAQQMFLTPGTVRAVLEEASADGLKFFSSPTADARSLATGRTP